MYPSELVTRVQHLLKEPSTSALATPARVIDSANGIYVDWNTRIAFESDDWLRASTTIAVTAGTAEYALPPRCISVRSLINPDGAEYGPLAHFIDGQVFEETGFALRGDNVVISPTPSLSGTWTLWYDERPPVLTYGYAAAGGAKTITLAASPTGGRTSGLDDYYNGRLLVITAGKGVGDRRTVTGYVASTRVATVSANWSTTPDETSVYQTVPVFDEDWMHGLAFATAGELAMIDEREAQAYRLDRRADRAFRSLLWNLRRRQRRTVQRVYDNYWDF